MTLILSNEDIEQTVTMPECIAVLEEAYKELAAGRGVTRTRSDTLAPTARPDALYSLKSMDGIAPKLGVGAVRINSDIVSWPKRNGNARREKIPAAPNGRYVGLVLLFSSETGEPLAIFPDGVLQRLRVGATNGLGIKYLARPDAESVGILGSGWQAGGQLIAACCTRTINRARCFSPNPDHRAEFCREMEAQLGIEVVSVATPEDAVRGADIVLCASNSIDNIYFARWLRPGIHLSSIKRPEIEAKTLSQADRLVIHAPHAKPLHFMTRDLDVPETNPGKGWRLSDEVDFSTLPTLPELITGKIEGRTSPRQVTCFLNNIGLGYQFAAAGALVYRKVKEAGRGHELPTDWFTEDVHP
jgi:ornithine cyclodeaminase/alanine dehydrogenase-like protein (mu-crystallin family)